jgi:hypothetical protein
VSIALLTQPDWLVFPDNKTIDCRGFTLITPDKLEPQLVDGEIVYGYVPLWVGFPEISPVDELKVRPAGKIPFILNTSEEGVIAYLIGTDKVEPTHNVGLGFPETKLTVAF